MKRAVPAIMALVVILVLVFVLLRGRSGPTPAPQSPSAKPPAPVLQGPTPAAADASRPAPKKEKVDKKGRSKDKAVYTKFIELMEDNDIQTDGIEEDIKQNKGEPSIKKRLAQIRKNSVAARALQYRKDENEAEQLDGFFNVFDFKLKELEESAWDTAENSKNLLKQLQTRCGVCHDPMRD